MAIAKHFFLGETEVTIYDDYCKDKTPEEVDAILKSIAKFVQPVLAKEALEREKSVSAREQATEQSSNTKQKTA